MVRRARWNCLSWLAAFAGISGICSGYFYFYRFLKNSHPKSGFYEINAVNTGKCRGTLRGSPHGRRVLRLILRPRPTAPLNGVENIVQHHLTNLLDCLHRHVAAGLAPPTPGAGHHPQQARRILKPAQVG